MTQRDTIALVPPADGSLKQGDRMLGLFHKTFLS